MFYRSRMPLASKLVNPKMLPTLVITSSKSKHLYFPTAIGIGTIMVPITLNFTITNLHYTEMGHPGSLKFNSTKWILHYLVSPSKNPSNPT